MMKTKWFARVASIGPVKAMVEHRWFVSNLNQKKKKIKNFEINFFNRFARRIRVSGFYMAFQSMDQAAVSEITMAPQFSLGQARLYSLFVM